MNLASSIIKSSVEHIPIGIVNIFCGTLCIFSRTFAGSSLANFPIPRVSSASPNAIISSTKVPPLGKILNFPVIGASSTPVVSGSIVNGAFILFIILFISLISPGFTKPGRTQSFPVGVPDFSERSRIKPATMFANPVTCEPT